MLLNTTMSDTPGAQQQPQGGLSSVGSCRKPRPNPIPSSTLLRARRTRLSDPILIQAPLRARPSRAENSLNNPSKLAP